MAVIYEQHGDVTVVTLVPDPRLTEEEVEQYCATHRPLISERVTQYEVDGVREECHVAASGLGWRHFHHSVVPNVVTRTYLVEWWELPDGRRAGRRSLV